MAESPDDFSADVSIVLRHYRFIVALVVIAAVVAVVSGFLADSPPKARSSTEIEVKAGTPLFGGPETAPTLDTFEKLAASEAVQSAAAAEAGITPEELRDKISISTQARNPRDIFAVDKLTIEATGDTQNEAAAIASAMVHAFETQAEQVKVDPEVLASQQAQADLARKALEESDQSQVLELDQVRSDLQGQRDLVAKLKAEASAIETALGVVRAEANRPLAELKLAVSAILGSTGGLAGIDEAPSAQELIAGLELRRQVAESVVSSAQAEIEQLATREQELIVETGSDAGLSTVYSTAERNVAAAEVAQTLNETEVTVTSRGVDASGGGAQWPARLGAAVAFGLVAGIGGAFALEFGSTYMKRRQRGEGTSTAGEA